MREKQSYRDNLSALDRQYPDRVALTMADAAVALGLDYRTVQRNKEKLPFVKIGKSFVISKADLARYISA